MGGQTKYKTKWYKKNRDKVCARRRELHRLNKGRVSRKCALRRDFGITLEEYDDMFDVQDGVCALCGQPETDRRLAVDHSHKTGKVRGLLCFPCNVFVGRMENNIDLTNKCLEWINEEGSHTYVQRS